MSALEMESVTPGASFDSLNDRSPESSSGKSPKRSVGNSQTGQAGDVGSDPESRRAYYDWLLSQLHAITGDLKDAGIETHLYVGNASLTITFADVRICKGEGKHSPIFHSGKECPVCKEES